MKFSEHNNHSKNTVIDFPNYIDCCIAVRQENTYTIKYNFKCQNTHTHTFLILSHNNNVISYCYLK